MKHSRNILLILILCSGLCISSALADTSPETFTIDEAAAEYDIQPRVNSAAPFSGLDGIMQNDVEYVMTTPVFSDDMSTSNKWLEWDGTGNNRDAWHLDTTTYTSAPSSAATGPYGNDWEQWIITTESISLDGLTHPGIRFEWFVDTEYEHDYAYVGISKDGMNFNITGVSGNSSEFVEATVDLTDYFDGIDYTGKDIWIAFMLESDASTTGNGVWIDDIQVGQLEEEDQLDANFTADVTNGTAPLTVNFTDTSTGEPTAWAWDFGNGDTSTDQNASYTYTTAGNYTVSLTVEDEEENSDTETKEGYITVLPGESPVIRFSPDSSSVRIGTETVHSVVLDSVPKGLAGFNLTLSLGNQTVAEIVGTAPPEWASNWSTSDAPADSVWISAEDFDSMVNPGETDILLGNVTVRGDAEGTTELTIVVNEMEDDSGNAITPLTEPAAITVNYTLVPFPGASAPPTDPDNDGLFEDINGNGQLDFDDVVLYVKEIEWIPDNQQISFFDFNENGQIDFDDAVQLAREVV